MCRPTPAGRRERARAPRKLRLATPDDRSQLTRPAHATLALPPHPPTPPPPAHSPPRLPPPPLTLQKKKPYTSDNTEALRRHIHATLGSGNLREAVQLPPGEDMNEWLALNTWDFYNAVAMLHGSIAEFCTPERCPKMSAGPKYEYRWADSKGTRPIQLSAPEYVARLFAWIEGQVRPVAVAAARPLSRSRPREAARRARARARAKSARALPS